jgi:DNA repair exonuclease SbcCD ATPase subunit
VQIVKLTVENVMRISAVEITPTGNVVVIGGRNGAGKTSVLAAIEMALGGKDHAVDEPVRKGEARGRIVVDLGEIVVERVFSASGGTKLAVRAASGAVFPSPQAMLDHLVGKLAFDPLAFARSREREQAAILRGVVQLDTTALDTQRLDLFSRRTDVNRDVARLKSHLASMPPLPEGDIPESEVDPAELVRQLQAVEKRNLDRGLVIQTVPISAGLAKDAIATVDRAEQLVEHLQQQLESAKNELERARGAAKRTAEGLAKAKAEAERARAEMEPTEPLIERVKDCQKTNALVRLAKDRRTTEEALLAAAALSDEMTTAMEQIDASKRKLVAEAKFPIDGLGFEGEHVTLNGIPFSQASGAEQLRASLAIGMALNPKLRVLIARDGSLLDEDGLALLAELADENGFQVWLERVGRGTEVSFLIEDGQVAYPPPETPKGDEVLQ